MHFAIPTNVSYLSVEVESHPALLSTRFKQAETETLLHRIITECGGRYETNVWG